MGTAALCPAAGEHGDAEDEALLDDEHQDAGDDEGGEALRGVADKDGVGAYGGGCAHGGIGRLAYDVDGLLTYVGVEGYLELGEVEQQGAVAQQQGGIAVEADHGLFGAAYAAVIVTRYLYDGVAVMGRAPLPGLAERGGIAGYTCRGERVDGTRKPARGGGARVVDDCHRGLADHLVVIYKRVYDGIDRGQEEEEKHHTGIGEHQAEFTAAYEID